MKLLKGVYTISLLFFTYFGCYGQGHKQLLESYLTKLYEGFPLTKDSLTIYNYVAQNKNATIRTNMYDSTRTDYFIELITDSFKYKPQTAQIEYFRVFGGSLHNSIVSLL